MNRKYIATLALAAVLVIVVGLLIKPQNAVQVPVPGAEAAPLQRLSQEAALRAEARYFADRIVAVATQVLFVPELGVSGVRWDSAGRVVTTLPALPITTTHVPLSGDTSRVAPAVAQPERALWVLVVGRRTDGRPVSAVGRSGGLAPIQCGDAVHQEIILDVPLHSVLAGAGVFDLNGDRLGVVLRCGAQLAAIPAGEIDRALLEAESLPRLLRRQLGLTIEPLDAGMRAYFRSDSGLFVREVQEGRTAAQWGLRPGDVLLSLDGRTLTEIADLRVLTARSGDYTLELLRDGRRTRMRVSNGLPAPGAASMSTDFAAMNEGVLVRNIAPGSLAQRAGLRRGDIIVQVESTLRPGAATVQRALARGDSVPVFLVVQRASVLRGILLTPSR